MGYYEIGSADPKYLAATDILIGDMSNINYEFLVYNRPIILLSNNWLFTHFPDIGIKTGLKNIESAIHRSIKTPDEYEGERKYWLDKVIYSVGSNSSKKYINLAIERSGYSSPNFILLTGNNKVRETNLVPIYKELIKCNYKAIMKSYIDEVNTVAENSIIFGAHYQDLLNVRYGFRVHIDHDLKAPATANLAQAKKIYKKHKFFENIDLHITAGFAGYCRTLYIMDKFKERVVIGGYPKIDNNSAVDSQEVKKQVCAELGIDFSKPLITYAPAMPNRFMKPGGSLSINTLKTLKQIGDNSQDFNILAKLKYNKPGISIDRFFDVAKSAYNLLCSYIYDDGGSDWGCVINDIVKNDNK